MRVRPGRGDDIARLDLDDGERSLLAALLSDVAAMLSDDDEAGDGLGGADELAKLVGLSDATRPEDPALLRLLPDVDSSDPERSAEFRRYTDTDLRETKLHHIRVALAGLGSTGEIALDRQTADMWMRALNDVRLVLGSRMGIVTDDDAEALMDETADHDERTEVMLSVYDVLTWLQEAITQLMLSNPDGDPAP